MRSLLILLTAWAGTWGGACAQVPISIDDAISQERANLARLAQSGRTPQLCSQQGLSIECNVVPGPQLESFFYRGDLLDSRAVSSQLPKAKYESLARLVSLLEQKAVLLEISMAYPPRTLWEFQTLRQAFNAQRLQIYTLEKKLAGLQCKQGQEIENARSE